MKPTRFKPAAAAWATTTTTVTALGIVLALASATAARAAPTDSDLPNAHVARSVEPRAALATSVARTASTAGTSRGASSPTSPLGRWITASGNLEVEIAPCGPALCGTVTRVLANRSMSREGEAMTPADTRAALGMVLLQGLVLPPDAASDSGDARYSPQWQGTIYNRENGKTYRCLMHVSTADVPQGELVLRAYVGLPILGKTQRWTRAPLEPVAGAPSSAARAPAQGRPDGPAQLRDADASDASPTVTR